jgi:hypothetical protein
MLGNMQNVHTIKKLTIAVLENDVQVSKIEVSNEKMISRYMRHRLKNLMPTTKYQLKAIVETISGLAIPLLLSCFNTANNLLGTPIVSVGNIHEYTAALSLLTVCNQGIGQFKVEVICKDLLGRTVDKVIFHDVSNDTEYPLQHTFEQLSPNTNYSIVTTIHDKWTSNTNYGQNFKTKKPDVDLEFVTNPNGEVEIRLIKTYNMSSNYKVTVIVSKTDTVVFESVNPYSVLPLTRLITGLKQGHHSVQVKLNNGRNNFTRSRYSFVI